MSKVVLAYSGGLDTSVILRWLIDEGHEVIAYIADVGQREDFEAAAQKAIKVGASKVFVEDLKREFVTDYIFTALKASALYEGRYLLGTALARPIIAKRQIEIAQREGAEYVSHGATGKGNDQVRFELAYYALAPGIKVIAPWKTTAFLEQFAGRSDLIAYAEKHGIPVTATAAKPYSTDGNLMHISYEAGVLENPATPPPADMFQMTVDPLDAPDQKTALSIRFEHGIPVAVGRNDDSSQSPTTKTHAITDPLDMFLMLNDLAGANGVGRIDIVENRFVGIKSRGVYETPGGTVLWAAHQDLETIALDREVLRIKQSLSPRFAELIYNGFWFSPEFRFLTAVMDESQRSVTGTVNFELYKGNVTITGRSAEAGLYNEALSSMDIAGGYDQRDAEGFIKINSLRLRADPPQ